MVKITHIRVVRGPNTAKSALLHDQICHQFGGSTSEISVASLASAKTSSRIRASSPDEGRPAELGQVRKFGPQDLVEKPIWCPDHGVVPLPIIPVGPHAIASAQRKKQMARPLISHRELHPNRRIFPAECA
jgi:hypothetical protein